MLLSILFILFGADELRVMLKSFKLKKSSMNMDKKRMERFSSTPKEDKIEDTGRQRQIDYSKGQLRIRRISLSWMTVTSGNIDNFRFVFLLFPA